MNGQLSDVMLEICENEFSAYESKPPHRFSLHFRRKMNRMIKEQYVPPEAASAVTIRRMKYAIIALVTAVVLLTGFIATDTVFMKESDELFGFDVFTVKYSGNAPTTIENYYEPVVPDGFIKIEEFSYSTDTFHVVSYYNGDFGYTFSQSVISEFYLGIEKDKAIAEFSYSENRITMRYEGGIIVDTIWCDGIYVYHLGTVNSAMDMLDLDNLQEVFPEEVKTIEEIYVIK